jgi:hypothetical protein
VPKLAKEMGPLEVSRLNGVGFHNVGGVPGLTLQVVETKAKSWVLRVMIGGKRRKMGLGGYPGVTLANAREKAREAKEKIANGIDPITQRKEAKRILVALKAKDKTFQECAEAYLQAHKAG